MDFPGIQQFLRRELRGLEHGLQFVFSFGNLPWLQSAQPGHAEIAGLLLKIVNGAVPFVDIVVRAAGWDIKEMVWSGAIDSDGEIWPAISNEKRYGVPHGSRRESMSICRFANSSRRAG